ncbi:HD domain protein [Calycomorphotria hydatis]|uniref:HD domain protein n=2 Tax=Calycomorphotria hydatis TaxID=2528027 RepID=A0A517T604_9PLAN|nr:HD domain protein [Calycomorphotria hydatis]
MVQVMHDYSAESLSHDPIHGYIPFVSSVGVPAGETAEQEIIDNPWVQRLRQIHQLQTAWYVFPSAEHMRFQHVLGAMHLATVVIDEWYESLASVCENVPSKGYVESLCRMAALLHDVGHGPYGHFFDDKYLAQFGETHETIGKHIIVEELGELLRGIRRTPNGQLKELEELDPAQVAWLICRPKPGEPNDGHPDWLRKLRSLFSGIYTVDNMDFVLRDAYMSGYNTRVFDLWRLIHYSFFTSKGLTIHARGMPTLINFIESRANLFRSIYFHRAVRGIDKSLEDVFPETIELLFPGNPLEHLDAYQRLTELSFLVDVHRLPTSDDPQERALGQKWHDILCRRAVWRMAAERTVSFHDPQVRASSLFSQPDLIESLVRSKLPESIREIELRVDSAPHYHRPSGPLPTGGQNFLLDPSVGEPTILNDDELFRSLPISFAIFRIYSKDHQHDDAINAALNAVLGTTADTKTNM